MLRLKYVLGLASYVGHLALATPIGTHYVSNGQSLYLNSILPSNESVTLPLNLTGSRDTQIHCDGASYGFDLDVFDCEEAKAYVPRGRDQVQWVERNTAWQKEHVPLPYRSMGSKAACYVQPVLVEGATSARASANEVRNAAAMIRGTCFAGGKLQGGMATKTGKEISQRSVYSAEEFRLNLFNIHLNAHFHVGGDNNLAVIMGAYKSPSAIKCQEKLDNPSNCIKILDDMLATKNQQIFGRPNDPSATASVPNSIASGRLVSRLSSPFPTCHF